MSNEAMDLLLSLIRQGYRVDMSANDTERYVRIKIYRNRWNAATIITYDELDLANFDVGLHRINQLIKRLNA